MEINKLAGILALFGLVSRKTRKKLLYHYIKTGEKPNDIWFKLDEIGAAYDIINKEKYKKQEATFVECDKKIRAKFKLGDEWKVSYDNNGSLPFGDLIFTLGYVNATLRKTRAFEVCFPVGRKKGIIKEEVELNCKDYQIYSELLFKKELEKIGKEDLKKGKIKHLEETVIY